jgi:hypothetical protein
MLNSINAQIEANFGFKLTGIWPDPALNTLAQAGVDFRQAFHLDPLVRLNWMQRLEIRAGKMSYEGLTSRGLVRLNPENLSLWTVVHELAHAWDSSQDWTLSLQMMTATHSWGPPTILHGLYPLEKRYWYHVGAPPPPCGVDQNFNRKEDFAEAVTAFVYPEEASRRATARGYPYSQYGYLRFSQTPRGKFIAALAESLQEQEKAL